MTRTSAHPTRHPWIAITSEPWTFPDDLPLLEAKLAMPRMAGPRSTS